MAFQKSNWTHTAGSEKARVYASGAITNTAINFGTQTTYTVTVPFQFQGSGQVEVSIPAGQPSLNTGLSLGEANLLAPASGSYSLGNHPRIQFKVSNTSNTTNFTPTATDVIFVQF